MHYFDFFPHFTLFFSSNLKTDFFFPLLSLSFPNLPLPSLSSSHPHLLLSLLFYYQYYINLSSSSCLYSNLITTTITITITITIIIIIIGLLEVIHGTTKAKVYSRQRLMEDFLFTEKRKRSLLCAGRFL